MYIRSHIPSDAVRDALFAIAIKEGFHTEYALISLVDLDMLYGMPGGVICDVDQFMGCLRHDGEAKHNRSVARLVGKVLQPHYLAMAAFEAQLVTIN